MEQALALVQSLAERGKDVTDHAEALCFDV